MSYNQKLADKVREELILAHGENIGEIKMYGGLAFMVNSKMCICIGGSEQNNVMVRIGKNNYDESLAQIGVSPTLMKDRPIKGYIDLDKDGQIDLRRWVRLALEFNEELIKI